MYTRKLFSLHVSLYSSYNDYLSNFKISGKENEYAKNIFSSIPNHAELAKLRRD